jgi:predicted transcriptional regulator
MKIKVQGKEVEAKPIEFITKKEDFNEYMLTNGIIMQMKTVVTKIYLLEGIEDQDENQSYLVKSQNVIAPIEVP